MLTHCTGRTLIYLLPHDVWNKREEDGNTSVSFSGSVPWNHAPRRRLSIMIQNKNAQLRVRPSPSLPCLCPFSHGLLGLRFEPRFCNQLSTPNAKARFLPESVSSPSGSTMKKSQAGGNDWTRRRIFSNMGSRLNNRGDIEFYSQRF